MRYARPSPLGTIIGQSATFHAAHASGEVNVATVGSDENSLDIIGSVGIRTTVQLVALPHTSRLSHLDSTSANTSNIKGRLGSSRVMVRRSPSASSSVMVASLARVEPCLE